MINTVNKQIIIFLIFKKNQALYLLEKPVSVEEFE